MRYIYFFTKNIYTYLFTKKETLLDSRQVQYESTK